MCYRSSRHSQLSTKSLSWATTSRSSADFLRVSSRMPLSSPLKIATPQSSWAPNPCHLAKEATEREFHLNPTKASTLTPLNRQGSSWRSKTATNLKASMPSTWETSAKRPNRTHKNKMCRPPSLKLALPKSKLLRSMKISKLQIKTSKLKLSPKAFQRSMSYVQVPK